MITTTHVYIFFGLILFLVIYKIATGIENYLKPENQNIFDRMFIKFIKGIFKTIAKPFTRKKQTLPKEEEANNNEQ